MVFKHSQKNTSLVDALRSGLLIGNMLQELLGCDIDVARFPIADSTKKDGQFLPLHNTIATFEGQFLGTAACFWSGTQSSWDQLATTRMKLILNDCGYTIQKFSSRRCNRSVARAISCDTGIGAIYFLESLRIDSLIETVRNPFLPHVKCRNNELDRNQLS